MNHILYMSNYSHALDEPCAQRVAESLISERTSGEDPQRYLQGLRLALETDAVLTDAFPSPHSEAAFRRFLELLIQRLEALKPWPEPPFVRQPPVTWPPFADPVPLAVLRVTAKRLTELLHVFYRLVEGAEDRAIFVLRLRTEEVVALSAMVGAPEITLYRRPSDDPAQTLEHFLTLTGIDPGLVTPIAERPW